MQRYKPAYIQIPVVDAFPRAVCVPADDGDYVLYSDSLAREAALQERVKKLTEVLRNVILLRDHCELTYEDAYAFLKGGYWQDVRLALREDEP